MIKEISHALLWFPVLIPIGMGNNISILKPPDQIAPSSINVGLYFPFLHFGFDISLIFPALPAPGSMISHWELN